LGGEEEEAERRQASLVSFSLFPFKVMSLMYYHGFLTPAGLSGFQWE